MSGILLLDKPSGCPPTRRCSACGALLGADKAGHAGSLDPLASGMLPICLGEATKVAGDISPARKRYQLHARSSGRAPPPAMPRARSSERAPVPPLTHAAGRARTARAFRGAQQQVPPMYSALKRDGQPLYKLARAGIDGGARRARASRSCELSLLQLGRRTARARGAVLQGHLRAGAGGGHCARPRAPAGTCTALRRLYVEPFASEPMLTLDELRGRARAWRAAGRCCRSDRALLAAAGRAPRRGATRSGCCRARRCSAARSAPRVRLYDAGGRFLGLGEPTRRGCSRAACTCRPCPKSCSGGERRQVQARWLLDSGV